MHGHACVFVRPRSVGKVGLPSVHTDKLSFKPRGGKINEVCSYYLVIDYRLAGQDTLEDVSKFT